MKRNRVVAMLMAGIMAMSQPVSIYASEFTPEFTEEVQESENTQEEDASEIEIQDGVENEISAEDEDINNNIQNDEQLTENDTDIDNTEDDIFSDGSKSDIDAVSEDEIVTNLQWNGQVYGLGEQNVTIDMSYEDGGEMEDSDSVIANKIEQELLNEVQKKIAGQMLNSSVISVASFDLRKIDENGNDKDNDKSYRIKLTATDLTVIKGTRLFHQKTDGEIEEITFTSANLSNSMQEIEFVSSDGLGYFMFANVNQDLLIADKNSQGTQAEISDEDITIESQEEDANTDTQENNNGSNEIEAGDAENKDSVTPVDISEFEVSFVSGATNTDGKNVWNPSDSASGHAFIYRVNYTMSGVFSTDVGAFKIELPLHILKDKDGNWADTFNCPYWMKSEVTENDNPDFVYEIDEENNKVTIYNYKPYPTGEAGYVEFSYETTKDTTNYTDMGSSTKVNAKVYATNVSSTVTAEAEADEVYIDTHATIAYTQKKKPTLYRNWNNSWGEKPSDVADYYYLVWPIRTYVNKNTSSYDFYLNDVITDMESEVIGYRFSGQSQFSKENNITDIVTYGDRYDYVLTRYSKAKADEMIKNSERYNIHNDITATVSPADHIDEDTSATSSYDWFYESPIYNGKNGDFWAEKYGIYGDYTTVESSEDISNYTLGEFESGEIDTLSYLKYHAIGDGAPYSYSLADGATGTVDDALNGLYWQKKVDYNLVDDGIYIEKTKLNDEDYDIARSELIPVVKEAEFDETTYSFKSQKKTSGFDDDDNIYVFVRTDSGWSQAAIYDLNNKEYDDINEEYVKSANKRILNFKSGVKALQYKCSHSYFYTELNIYPEISLNRTEHVQDILKDNPEKIAVSNEIDFVVSQNEKTILDRKTKGTDYAQKVIRESEIKKDVIKTENIKKESRFEVTWNVNFQETYADNNGMHFIYQNSGIFYDLLPVGCDFNTDSLIVMESGSILSKGEYEYSLTENYKNSGRTLLTVSISMPTRNEYSMQYNTSHDYNSINDYGRNLLNSVVYESGNERIGEGMPDNGGNITDSDILKDIDPNTDAEKFAYSEARYEVNFPVAAVTGLKKQVKNSTSKVYSYNEVVHKDEKYSYKIRMTNDSTTKAKDIIFFDSLENFYQDAGQQETTIKSDWKGTLKGIDVSQITYKGAAPVIYLSKMDSLNPNEHNDLNEVTQDGEPVWMQYEEFSEVYGLDKATAIAIDATKCEDGSDFLLNEKESVSFIIYMQAPAEDISNKQDPVACNNIFVSRTAIKEIGEEVTEIAQFYHQDYTQAHYRISGDVNFIKVDATDEDNQVQGVTYKLTGTSDYGTFYDEERVSNKMGQMSFQGIEKGKYELKEINCSDDWQLDKNSYVVIIDGKGQVKIEGLKIDKDVFILTDEPRYHADIAFQKVDLVTNGAVEGAVFKLAGTSDYGNEYTLYAKSNKIGRVSFKNIELGTYELKEVEAPDGYIKSKITFIVKVDENGKATLYNGDKELDINGDNFYQIENEPYHSIRFLKSSTYGENIYLEGAEFNLTGISDYGTSVNKTSISGRAEDGGLVVFDNLEPGTYTLKETKAPEGHYLDEKPYKVVVNRDGTFTIDGLEKIEFGKSTE